MAQRINMTCQDAYESGLGHTVIGTAANVGDVTQASALLHGQESELWGYAGYQGLDKREEFKERTMEQPARCNIAMRPGKRRAQDPERELHQLQERA